MAFSEDLTPFFDLAGFASPATIAGVPVRGIFDRPHQLASVGAYGVASTQPTYTLRSADVPAGVVGLSLVHAATSYTVAAHEPDGTGISTLVLEVA